MTGVFSRCKKLKNITGLSLFNTGNVINMDLIFSRCESLTDVDISSFDTKNLASVPLFMFSGCVNLVNVKLPVSFKNNKIIDNFDVLFKECPNLDRKKRK